MKSAMKSEKDVRPVIEDLYEKELGKDPKELIFVRIKNHAYEVITDWDRY